jgi:hypothetical protein
MFITVHPDQVLPIALASVGMVLAVGNDPQQTFALFCKPLQISPPQLDDAELASEAAMLWPRSLGKIAYPLHIAPSTIEHQRHVRKYAIGELPPDRSFYFHGADGKLNLRAQNLYMFLQLAEGVDADSWSYHLRQGDYSTWFRTCIKDELLAAEAARIEQDDLSADESRAQFRELIERSYVPSLSPPLPIPGTDAAPVRQG